MQEVENFIGELFFFRKRLDFAGNCINVMITVDGEVGSSVRDVF